MRVKIGSKIKGWTVVHAIRTRSDIDYDGVFLATREGRWMTAREHTGKSLDDGIQESGEWWYGEYFDNPETNEPYRWNQAVDAYEELAKKAGSCWSRFFHQRAREAVAEHLAALDPMGTWDLAAYWNKDGDTVAGATFLLPARKAKESLLEYMHVTPAVRDAFRTPENLRPGSDVDKAFQHVIGAKGDVRVRIGAHTFGLTHQASYGKLAFPHRPHPDWRAEV
ncbi:hypothetical protein [Streptomyces goshikiensis]